MTKATQQLMRVIVAFKAYWYAGPGQLDEKYAERELADALDAMEEENVTEHTQEAGAQHGISRRHG